MPLSDAEFLRFIILVIPGLWALRIYKGFCGKTNEQTSWDTEFAFSISFGLLGYLATTSFEAISQRPILLQFLFSTACAVGIAILFGIFNRSSFCLSLLPSVLHSKLRDIPVPTSHTSGLDYIWREHINPTKDKRRVAVAVIYTPGDRDNAEVGVVTSYSGINNELTLSKRPPLSVEQIDNLDWAIKPWMQYVSTENGMVVEVAYLDDTEYNKIYDAYVAP